jgi:hypothetical protein
MGDLRAGEKRGDDAPHSKALRAEQASAKSLFHLL